MPVLDIQPVVGQDSVQFIISSLSGDARFNHESEPDLWDRFRAGCDKAFRKIYDSYVNVLYNYGKRYTQDDELIKDCIQDFFIYLSDKRDRLGCTTSIKYYLLRSFRRRLFLYMEKSSSNQFPEVGFDLQFEDCKTLKFINQDSNDYLSKVINKSFSVLKPKQREAVYLYYFEEMEYRQIAKVMEFKHVSSARRLIYSALHELRGILTEN